MFLNDILLYQQRIPADVQWLYFQINLGIHQILVIKTSIAARQFESDNAYNVYLFWGHAHQHVKFHLSTESEYQQRQSGS